MQDMQINLDEELLGPNNLMDDIEDRPDSPGRAAIEGQKRKLGGVKRMNEIKGVGVGVGMTKAFGQIGGVMMDAEEAMTKKDYVNKNHIGDLQRATTNLSISRQEKRLTFMNKL